MAWEALLPVRLDFQLRFWAATFVLIMALNLLGYHIRADGPGVG